MSYSLFFPSQWDDFASSDKQGSSIVSRVLRPKMDIVETGEAFIVTTEFPGAKKEDISIDLQNGRLTVSTQTKSSNEHQQGKVRVSERSFGSFSRTIAVPETITHDQIKASFSDGVLEVKVPKLKIDKETRRIQIS